MTPLRIDLKSVILDGSLNRFKDPLLVLKPELGPVPRGPYTDSQLQDRPATRRQVLQIHIRDRAFELEQLYLDTFSSSQIITSPAQRHTVCCSRPECSLTFHYQKDETDNQQRTLMVRFQVSGDLEAVIDRLKTCGVEVEVNHAESQGSSGFSLQPQQQVLEPAPVASTHQQFLYHGGPPLPIVQGSQGRDLTPPAARTLDGIEQSIEVTTLSQSAGHAQSVPKRQKRTFRGNEPPIPQADEKRSKPASRSKRASIPRPRSKGYQSTREAATRKVLENRDSFAMGLASVGSTVALTRPESTPLESTDPNEDVDTSSQTTIVIPPPAKSDNQLIQELMITHDVLSEATKVWNKLKERGQTGTKGIEDLQEIQKMWVSLGEELVQHLHSRLVATVGELREARRQATGQ